MLVLLLFLSILAIGHTMLTLSLYENKVLLWSVVGVIAISVLVMLPLSMKVNTLTMMAWVQSKEVLLSICTFQIVESMAVMFLTIRMMRNHFLHRDQGKILTNGILFPNGLVFVFLFVGLGGLLHVAHQWSYWLIALMMSAAVVVVLFLSVIFLRMVFQQWIGRLEMKIIINFFQILVAMFIPLMLTGTEMREQVFEIEWIKSSLVLMGMMLFVISGWFMHKLAKERKKC